MQCPQCQSQNPDQAKFCLECGAKLQAICPECGAALPPEAKFCFECGAKIGVPVRRRDEETSPLQAPAAAPLPDLMAERLQRLIPKEFAERLLAAKGKLGGERRVVTMLFSDVKGSTAMAEQLDPEDVMDIMNGAFEVLIPPVYRCEGTLARLMGDAILAFFGAPLAHEDDPERAVRCALEIAAGAREYAAKLERERGLKDFSVRVGIHTGLVVVGEVGTDLRVEYTAMGDAINLAARMEQNAPVGGVLISHDTYLQVRGLFEVQALEPITVKGKAEPVRVYTVQRARPRAFRLATRGIEGVETRMVGRESEMKRLQDAFYLALEDAERQMVTISGESGVGKTRLLWEFESWLEGQTTPIRYYHGRASPELQNVPYALLRDLFVLSFDINDSDPAGEARGKLERGLGERLARDEQGQIKAHIIGQLLGFDFSASPHLAGVFDDARQLRDRALIYLAEFFRSAASLASVVILLEDIQWADDSSLDAINHLALALPSQRLLIVTLARPALFDRRPHWGEGQLFHTHLALQPLSKRESRQLVDEILRRMAAVPAKLREMVVAGSEGNPLYLEELIKVLIEQRVIVKGLADAQYQAGGHPRANHVGLAPQPTAPWQVDEQKLAELRVPPTLTGVLQARLDSLPLQQRSVLQQAAVVGRTFWDRAVERISQATKVPADDQVPDALSALRGREMVAQRETSAFVEAQEFVFRHAALREVAYESILKKVRRGYHALVADWLMEHRVLSGSGERASEYTGLIAEHLELAGRADEALVYLRRAGEQAAAQFANVEAVDYYTRALKLLEQVEQQAQYPGPQYPGPQYSPSTLGRPRPEYSRATPEYSRATPEYSRATPEYSRAQAREQQYALILGREGAYGLLGKRQEQLADLEQLAGLADELDDAPGTGVPGTGLHRIEARLRKAAYLDATSDFAAAMAAADEAVQLAARIDETECQARHRAVDGLVALSRALWRQAIYDEAQLTLEEALALARQIPYARGEANSLHSLGSVSFFRGDMQAARERWEQGLALYRTLGNQRLEAVSLGNLVAACAQLGDVALGKEYSEQALTKYQTIGDRRGEASALSNLAGMQHMLGDLSGAREVYQRCLELCRAIGDRQSESGALSNLGTVLHDLGDNQAACECCEQALAIKRAIGDRRGEGYALSHLAWALEALGELDIAGAAFQQALNLRREIGQPGVAMDDLAGLARIALRQGQLEQAVAYVEEAWAWIVAHGDASLAHPVQFYLSVDQVWTEAGQAERAAEALAAARRLVEERAARISDESLRASFRERVPLHRRLWARLEEQARGSGAEW